MRNGYVYILTNKPNGVLYIGVTSDLVKRIHEHRTGAVSGFSESYNLKHLVFFEIHDRIDDAILREKKLKKWKREWKVNLIVKENPNWDDLWQEIVK